MTVLERFVRLVEPQPWMIDAACRGMGPKAFVPDAPAHRDRQSVRRYMKAKEVCATCPVTAQCAEYGRDERHGVWGGTTPADRSPRMQTTAIVHGTDAGYRAHFNRHDEPCEACRHAHTRERNYRKQRGHHDD